MNPHDDLTHLRAESLRLVSANDALEKERSSADAVRRDLEAKALEKENIIDALAHERDGLREQVAVMEAKNEELHKSFAAELQTAQAAEARLREENHRLYMAYVDQVIATPPTAALPDGEELLDWLEDQNVCINGYQHYDKKTREKLELLKEQPTLRAFIRSTITGATK